MRFLINSKPTHPQTLWSMDVYKSRWKGASQGSQTEPGPYLIKSRAIQEFSRILYYPDRGVNRCSPN